MAKVRKRTWQSGGEPKTAWIADYFDRGGKRHQIAFPRKKDAERYLDEVKEQLRHGVHMPSSTSKTVAQAAQLWLQHCEQGTADSEPLEASTIREYRRHANVEICSPDHGIGNRKLSDLTYADVSAFQTRLKDTGKSPAMIRKIRTSLSALLSDAMESGLVARNVIREAPRARNQRKARTGRHVDLPGKKELNALIEHASPKFRPLLVVLVFSGMRISEARGLHWRSVDLEKGFIRVQERADRFNKIGPPKSATSNREIPMAPMVRNVLKEWILGTPFSDSDDLVFPTERGSVQSLSNLVRRRFNPLQIECGIVDRQGKPKYGFHALRHAAASLFIESGLNAKQVQTLLGHSTIAMTMDTYAKLFKDSDSDLVAFEMVQARLVN